MPFGHTLVTYVCTHQLLDLLEVEPEECYLLNNYNHGHVAVVGKGNFFV